MDDDDSPRVMGEGMFEGFHVEQWSMRLHMAIVASLAFTIILVLMIVASRSWGVGERGEFEGMSAGLWKVWGAQRHCTHCIRAHAGLRGGNVTRRDTVRELV